MKTNPEVEKLFFILPIVLHYSHACGQYQGLWQQHRKYKNQHNQPQMSGKILCAKRWFGKLNEVPPARDGNQPGQSGRDKQLLHPTPQKAEHNGNG